jgi:hypothetical protein
MTSQQEAARRLRLALDLFETGVAIMEQNLRRENPQATQEEIQEMLSRWLRHRPGADLRMLLEAAGPAEVEGARSALKLIAERGFARGKDLLGELELLLTQGSGG